NYIEKFYVLFLNRANYVCGYSHISTGGMAGTVVDGKVVFTSALISGCQSLIISHNHPSSKMEPSIQDLELTKNLVAFGKMIQMPIIDHIIIGVKEGEYYSFAENGEI